MLLELEECTVLHAGGVANLIDMTALHPVYDILDRKQLAVVNLEEGRSRKVWVVTGGLSSGEGRVLERDGGRLCKPSVERVDVMERMVLDDTGNEQDAGGLEYLLRHKKTFIRQAPP